MRIVGPGCPVLGEAMNDAAPKRPFPIPAKGAAERAAVSRHLPRADADPYVTKDGSVIRELYHPDVAQLPGGGAQSLAEATVPPGVSTLCHLHEASEELYHVERGEGLMELGAETFAVKPGDTVVIAPGTPHRLTNTGAEDLVVICCCAPPYRHEDTKITE